MRARERAYEYHRGMQGCEYGNGVHQLRVSENASARHRNVLRGLATIHARQSSRRTVLATAGSQFIKPRLFSEHRQETEPETKKC